MMFRIYLDGTLINDQPQGFEDLKEVTEYRDDIKGRLFAYPSNLTFWGDGYTYIADKVFNSGVCTQISIQIEQRCDETADFDPLIDGYIFVTESTLNVTRCSVQCEISDNNFGSLIENNKNIPAVLSVGKSKNAEIISAATPATFYFETSDQTKQITGIRGYSVYEVFKFLIAFMTDDTVDFDSLYFRLGPGVNYSIFAGKAISGTLLNAAPTVTFAQMFREVDRKFNIAFDVDLTGARPKIFIEPASSLYENTVIDTLNNVNEVLVEFDRDKLYSVIRFGSDTVQDQGVLYSYPDVAFLGFRDESYHVLGQCNIDNTLDLTSEFIIDSNTIERTVEGVYGSTTGTSSGHLIDSSGMFTQTVEIGQTVYRLDTLASATITAINSNTDLTLSSNLLSSGVAYKIVTVTDFDQDIFLVETNGDHAKEYDTFNPGTSPIVYNVSLANNNVATRYLGAIPNSIAAWLDTTSNDFLAELTADTLYTVGATVILWDNDSTPPGFDTGGHYNPATGRYTAVTAGTYSFGTSFLYRTESGTVLGTSATVHMRHYDSGSGLLDDITVATIIAGIPPIISAGGVNTFYLSTGDYVTIEIVVNSGYTVTILTTNFIGKSDFNGHLTSEGGIYQTYDPNDIRIFIYKFTYPLSLPRYEAIKAATRKRIAFTTNGVTYSGWIKTLERDLDTGMCKFELLNKNS